jgi:hypothetical protein
MGHLLSLKPGPLLQLWLSHHVQGLPSTLDLCPKDGAIVWKCLRETHKDSWAKAWSPEWHWRGSRIFMRWHLMEGN